MSTLTISLPDELQAFVDEQASCGFASTEAYVADLIRMARLRALLQEGMDSPLGSVADDAYFEGLRQRIRDHADARK